MKKYILASTALLAATVASAQTTNQVVVSATRIDTPIEQIGSSISVIDASDIKMQNAGNAQDALRLIPGIQETQSGGPGTASSVFIRGANANQTLVLIDGIRVNSNTTGSFNLSSLPSDAIERIEVLRGPQSALHGADAIGGVINIVTKKGAKKAFGGSASMAVGEKGYRTGNLHLYGGGKIVDFNTSVSFQGLEEYDIAANYGGSEDDPYRGLSLHSGLGLNFLNDGRADLSLLYNNTKNDIDTGAPWPNWWQVDDLDRSTKKEFWASSLAISKPIGDRYTQNLSAGFNLTDTKGENDAAREYRFKTWNADFSAQGDIGIFEGDSVIDTLSVGYDFRHSEAKNDGNYAAETRDQHALFLSNLWKLNETLFITLGGRYDEFSDIDGQASGNAAISYFVLEGTRLHGSLGTGYKAPTMNDLYWPTTPWSGGNPNLDPEKSVSFDIGIEETLFDGGVVADITYFQNAIEDLIVWAPDGGGFWTPTNLDEANIKGAEASLAIKPTDNLTTRIFYTFTDAEDATTGNELARRAKHSGGASAEWQYNSKGSLYADLTCIGERFDNAANTRELDEYFLVGIGARYALSDSAMVTLHISDLLDEYYETAGGYGPVGRVASAGVEVNF
ncbi:MAG: TonB-dependent receptor [Verrucomicrobiota bacterium]